jgi:hypothetical protein
MNKAEILAEERRQGKRLLDMRRQYNAKLAGGAKQVEFTTRGKTAKKAVTVGDFSKEIADVTKKEVWTHNNLRVTNIAPALGPWISVEDLLRMGKPRIVVA